MSLTVQAVGYAIVALGCQRNIHPSVNCGYVGNYVQVGHVTTMRPSNTRTTEQPKLVTYYREVMQIGKVECKPCSPKATRCVDCTNAPWTTDKVTELLSRVSFKPVLLLADEEPPDYGAPNCPHRKCGTGTR